MKIAVCDDNIIELIQIGKIIELFKASHILKSNIKCDTYLNGMDLLTAMETGKSYDIIILDIIMPSMTGIEVAREIRKINGITKIIFLTSSPEYAVESYTVKAFFYLLKPIINETLLALLENAVTEIEDKTESILIKGKKGLVKILTHNIEYIEVLGRTLFFHMINGDILEGFCTLSQLENDLMNDKRFIKPHRSYLVNMDYIHHLSNKNIIMFSSKSLPIARDVYKDIKQTYIDYSFSGGKSQ